MGEKRRASCKMTIIPEVLSRAAFLFTKMQDGFQQTTCGNDSFSPWRMSPGIFGKTVVVLSVCLAAVVTVLGGQDNARAGQGAAPMVNVSICVGGAPAIPLLLAHEQGFFAAEGLQVELKKFRSTAEGFEAFFRGECELSSSAETLVVTKSFEHHDFRIVATYMTSDNAARILANRRSGIEAVKDLKGKRIHVFRGSSNHFLLDMFLARNGLSSQDVSMVFTDIPDVSKALADRIIDAFCASEVLVDKPKKELGKDALVFESPGLVLVSYSLSTTNRFIEEKPLVLQKVLAALLKNEAAIKKDRSAAAMTAARTMAMDEQDMRKIMDDFNWSVGLAQTLLLSMEQEARWMMSAGLTDKTSMPNYLDYVHRETLLSLKPEAVTMLK